MWTCSFVRKVYVKEQWRNVAAANESEGNCTQTPTIKPHGRSSAPWERYEEETGLLRSIHSLSLHVKGHRFNRQPCLHYSTPLSGTGSWRWLLSTDQWEESRQKSCTPSAALWKLVGERELWSANRCFMRQIRDRDKRKPSPLID